MYLPLHKICRAAQPQSATVEQLRVTHCGLHIHGRPHLFIATAAFNAAAVRFSCPTLSNSHIFLNPNPNTLPTVLNGRLALRHRQTVAHLKPRLHQQQHAGLQGHAVFAQPVVADIVYIQPQPVAGAA
jgi:hypothetical protein